MERKRRGGKRNILGTGPRAMDIAHDVCKKKKKKEKEKEKKKEKENEKHTRYGVRGRWTLRMMSAKNSVLPPYRVPISNTI